MMQDDVLTAVTGHPLPIVAPRPAIAASHDRTGVPSVVPEVEVTVPRSPAKTEAAVCEPYRGTAVGPSQPGNLLVDVQSDYSNTSSVQIQKIKMAGCAAAAAAAGPKTDLLLPECPEGVSVSDIASAKWKLMKKIPGSRSFDNHLAENVPPGELSAVASCLKRSVGRR